MLNDSWLCVTAAILSARGRGEKLITVQKFKNFIRTLDEFAFYISIRIPYIHKHREGDKKTILTNIWY